MAEPTGLEPATSDVTGRRSNQLNYDSALPNLLQKELSIDIKQISAVNQKPNCTTTRLNRTSEASNSGS